MNQQSRFLTTVFCLITIGLSIGGLITIYSTTYAISSNTFLVLQAIWTIVGILAASVIAFLPPLFLVKCAKWILAATILILAYLALANILHSFTKISLPLVTIRGGACRWLNIGRRITLQPSEFAKFGLILYLCSYYGSISGEQTANWKTGFLKPLIPAAITLGMIYAGNSLSVTLLCGIVTATTMYIAGVRMKFLVSAGVLGILLVVAIICLTPFRRQRLINHIFKNDTQTTVKVDNFQLDSAHCAMGSGGLAGLGLGNGRLKHKEIPEARTDFIFAVIGEEFGFLGILVGCILYLLFGFLSIVIGYHAPDKQGMLFCYAVGILIPVQAFVNLSVVSGFGPTTGVTAPLVSYGGSSVLSVALCIGLVLNVCRRNYLEEQKQLRLLGN